MRKINISILTSLFLLINSNYVLARPKKCDPPPIKKVEVKKDPNHYFTSNGIEVILKKETTNQIVGLSVFIKGGSRNLTSENAGIEKLLLQAMMQGSKNYPKDKMVTELSKIGAEINSSSFFDYSAISLKTINKYFDKSFDIFQSLINSPLLEEKEVNLEKNKMEQNIKANIDDPDEYVWKLVNSSFLKEHPYSNDFEGTLDSIKNINSKNLKEYLKNNFIGSKMLVVVTGNFDESIKNKLEKAFGKLPKGNYKYTSAPEVKSTKAIINIDDRNIPTAYIAGRFTIPSLRDKDYPATYLALRILSSKLNETVRTKKGLSYAVYSGASLRDANSGYMYVTTTKPKESIGLMFEEVNKLKNQEVSKKELEGVINLYYTEYFIQMEPVLDRANKLAVSQIMTNDYNNGYKLLEEFKKVTPKQIKEVVNKYLKNIHFGIIYKKELIDEKDFIF